MPYDREHELQEEIKQLMKEQETQGQVTPEHKESTQSDGSNVEPSVISQPEKYTAKDEWEEKALKIGWSPEHKGDNFVDAKEYILRKPLFERIERQNKELR